MRVSHRGCWRHSALALLVATAAVVGASSLSAAETKPPDPLRLLPDDVDFVAKIERPKALAELVVGLGSHEELEGFRAYRDYLGSTNYQLFRKVVSHFEHELGHAWIDLVDDLAGGGIVFAVKVDPKPDANKPEKQPVLFVMQGHDAAGTNKFFKTLVSVARQERERTGLSNDYKNDKYKGIETWSFHDELYAAVLDAALVYSNKPEALQAAIDRHLDPSRASILQSPSLIAGQKLLPKAPLVWTWFNLETPKKNSDFVKGIGLPSSFFPLHVAFGGLLDSIRRSAFVIAAISQTDGGAALNVRLPGGEQGMHSMVRAHLPERGLTAALPVLEPEGTLVASSAYLDLAEFWKQRQELLPADQLKQLEEGNGKSASVLYGTQMSRLLELLGARHRLVVARQKETGYKTVPKSPLPAFAVVLELRDADAFTAAIDGPIRGLAFLGQLQVSMTSVEQPHGGSTIIGYRIIENDVNKARDDGYLFNFSPCRARVGDKLIVSSTLELAGQLIDELEKQKTASTPTADPSEARAILHQRVRLSGVSQYLGAIQQRLVTQNMLEQGNSPEDATKEVSLFLQVLDHLGQLDVTNRYAPEYYELEIRAGK